MIMNAYYKKERVSAVRITKQNQAMLRVDFDCDGVMDFDDNGVVGQWLCIDPSGSYLETNETFRSNYTKVRQK